jgi:hypothetical protein
VARRGGARCVGLLGSVVYVCDGEHYIYIRVHRHKLPTQLSPLTPRTPPPKNPTDLQTIMGLKGVPRKEQQAILAAAGLEAASAAGGDGGEHVGAAGKVRAGVCDVGLLVEGWRDGGMEDWMTWPSSLALTNHRTYTHMSPPNPKTAPPWASPRPVAPLRHRLIDRAGPRGGESDVAQRGHGGGGEGDEERGG